MQLLETHKNRLEQWGWRWRLPEDSSKPVVLTHFGCVLDIAMSGLDLQVYLHQLSETNGSELLPPAVTRTLNAKACRSAVMFGDPLLLTECAQLLSALKATQLCFSCAHGRPTLIPLVHVQKLREQLLQKTASKLARPHLSSDTAGLKQRLTSLLGS